MSEKLSCSPQVLSEKNINRVPWRVRAFAATSLVFAGGAAVNCGGGEGDKEAVLGAEVTEVPSLTATVEITKSPTQKIEASPTTVPTKEAVDPITESSAIKAGLAEVYQGKIVPQGSCSVETINTFIDQMFEIYQKNPNKFTLTGQIATVYAELIVIADHGNAAAGDLAKSLRAGVEVLIEQHLKERNLPASNKAEGLAAWEQNVARKVDAIKDGSGCDIVIEKAK